MSITKITVIGEMTEDDYVSGKKADHIWTRARVDDGPIIDMDITIRFWVNDGHPLMVYLDGAHPLYPTVVYNEGGTLLGVSPGKTGLTL